MLRSRDLKLSRWFENAIVDSLVADLGRFDSQESPFKEKIGQSQAMDFIKCKEGLVWESQGLAVCNNLVLQQHCIECLHIAAYIKSKHL